MTEDSKRIIRQWNREIDDEIRRSRPPSEDGRWGILVWVLLWLSWLVLLVGAIGLFRRLHW